MNSPRRHHSGISFKCGITAHTVPRAEHRREIAENAPILAMVLDTCLWISLRLHADTWLRGDARGCDGGIRKELAAGVRYGQTEGERAQIPDSNDGGFPDPHPGGWDHLVASGHQGIWLYRLSNRPKSH